MSSHPLTITPASFNASAPVIRIAAGVSSPLARRDGGGPACVVLRLAQFRSAALGGASLIAGLARVGARICVTVGARLKRVFVSSQKGSVSGVFHVSEDASGATHELGIFTQGRGNV